MFIFLIASSGTWIDLPNYKGAHLNFISNLGSNRVLQFWYQEDCDFNVYM